MSSRLRNQRILAHPPLFEALDAYALSGTARPGVDARQRPMKFRNVAHDEDVVQSHLQIGKRGHKLLYSHFNGASPDGWSGTIRTARAARRVVSSDARRILTAPRGGVTFGEFTQRIQVNPAGTGVISRQRLHKALPSTPIFYLIETLNALIGPYLPVRAARRPLAAVPSTAKARL